MTSIIVETTIQAPLKKVWEYWTQPEHIVNWYFASPEWHAPQAENDLRKGGKFKTVMAAKDESAGFDFEGIYTEVKDMEYIEYELSDGRKVKISFRRVGVQVFVKEIFDAEDINPIEMQKTGWLAILNNFKKYTEKN